MNTPKKRNNSSGKTNNNLVHRQQTIEYAHQGPIPDPFTLEKYNSVIPAGADRIMIMAENQAVHRRKQDTERAALNKRGQWFGFIIAVLIILISGFLIYTDHEISGTILCSIDLVALVYVFITGKHKEDKPTKK